MLIFSFNKTYSNDKIIIGVDVSKDVLDIAYFYENGTKYLMQVPNTYEGILTFLKTIKKLASLKSYKTDLHTPKYIA